LRKARIFGFRSMVLAIFTSCSLPVMLTGCGGVNTTPGSAVPTVAVASTPTAITAGGSSTLSITATNATQVSVSGSDGTAYSLPASGGTQAVKPAATTTYTATAVGKGGQTATASATVTVTVVAVPAPTVTITASPTSVNAGTSSTLTVTATGATQVTVTGSDTSSYNLQPTGGTQVVSPASTTTYTATATSAGGTATATATLTVVTKPTVTIVANPTTVTAGTASILTVTATMATTVTVTGSDGTSFNLAATGGTQSVSPTANATYTATATNAVGTVTATATVTVTPPATVQSIDHVIFLLQENHTFDNYFGMLNPYRKSNGFNIGDDGVDYKIDGIDDKLSTTNSNKEGTSYSLFKLKSSCIQDMSSDWLASFGDVYPWSFSANRPILMSGYADDAEGYAKSCSAPGAAGSCAGNFPDLTGRVAMGYYDQDLLNYYYYMASQFALSDRWFSPVASKSIDNRLATFTGGTTQGIVKDPGGDDKLPALDIPTIFKELDHSSVSWKIYYTVSQAFCPAGNSCTGSPFPATTFSTLTDSLGYLYENPSGDACTAPTQASSVVGDPSNSFCIDINHIAPISTYYTDLTNGKLPSFAFIEAGYGDNDEHPGSANSILLGQSETASLVDALMASSSWKDSVFFMSYDEGGGPYDHVPPVPGHSNDFTSPSLGSIPDIEKIAVNPDKYFPCVPTGGTATLHCDLATTPYAEPGATAGDSATKLGFAAQLGFRLPNMVVSPFTRKHYVSHTPIDHTAIIKFVESRFIGASAHLTARDAAQPDLLEFFDFNKVPWATPPSPPAPVTAQSFPSDPCTPGDLGP
jgi:phospholipase C